MHKKDDFGLTNDLKTILKYTVEMFIEDGTTCKFASINRKL
nr:hypothetical protein [Mycoplasmopsis bovis]